MRLRTMAGAAALAAIAFAAGALWSHRGPANPVGLAERKVLYWVDPMDRTRRSDAPGIAPCGMPLEPVYADDGAGAAELPAGAVRVDPGRWPKIGVRVATARREPAARQVRLLGRVAADETRLYRIASVGEGWIRWVSPATTGSLVRKGERLAAYYSPDVVGPQQAYINAVGGLDRLEGVAGASEEQRALARKNVAVARLILANLGVGDAQLDAMTRTRQVAATIDVAAPSDGVVLARNVSLGQWFGRGYELYTIADLRKVWIVADAFDGDQGVFRPGARARVTPQRAGSPFDAVVSSVPPQFDPVSRTLRVRLEADNPGQKLRPGMFADVAMAVASEPEIVVPADAVLDTGTRKVVWIHRGEGVFEPREVVTGWSSGGRTAVTRGISEGESLAVSGAFLLDSETRMRLPAGAAPPAPPDPGPKHD